MEYEWFALNFDQSLWGFQFLGTYLCYSIINFPLHNAFMV